MKSWLLAALAAVGLLITLIAGPAYAQTAAATGLDLSPLLTLALQGVGTLLLLLAMWFIYGHVKDANMRAALLGILEKGVSLGYNATQGALKDKVVNVNVGSSIASVALKYALQLGPDALAHFGLTDNLPALAKMIWARLPAVDGPVTDDTYNQIVASATGTAAPAGSILSQAEDAAPLIIQALGDYLASKKAAAAAAPVAPVAPAA